MSVIVYSKPGCDACRCTTKFLIKEGIPFTEIDVTRNEAARKELDAHGYLSMPVVKTDHGSWSGYRRERLLDLKAVYGGEHHG